MKMRKLKDKCNKSRFKHKIWLKLNKSHMHRLVEDNCLFSPSRIIN